MYMITRRIMRADGKNVSFFTDCMPPTNATEALRQAEQALVDGVGVQIFDASAGRVITFSELRKAASGLES